MGTQEMLERAMERLESELDQGKITKEEFRQEMRDLQAEYREAAAEAANPARVAIVRRGR